MDITLFNLFFFFIFLHGEIVKGAIANNNI